MRVYKSEGSGEQRNNPTAERIKSSKDSQRRAKSTPPSSCKTSKDRRSDRHRSSERLESQLCGYLTQNTSVPITAVAIKQGFLTGHTPSPYPPLLL